MNHSVMVLQATLDELEQLAELFDKYRTFYKQEPDLEGAKIFLQERIFHHESAIFVAKEQMTNTLLGFVQLYPIFSSLSMQSSWILNDLFVREQSRGMGIGKMLLDMAKSYAVQTGAKGLSLETAPDNLGAQRLYEREGFVADTSYRHYHWSS